jgi:HlyD family secretion protein
VPIRFLMAVVGLVMSGCAASSDAPGAAAATPASVATVERRDVTRVARLHGTVEAASSLAVVVPRLAGQQSGNLVITRLVANGTRVRPGDVLVEFDRQAQLDSALERRAEWRDLEEQVKRLEAQHVEAAVKDDTLLKTTENALALARLEVDKNPLLPKIEAEKNLLSLEAAEAEAAQVRRTNALKREAARAERRTLEIRRDRALSALQHAERNAELLSVRAPIDGMVVLRSIWKSGRMGEPQEGEEVRGGLGLLDVVGETTMRVRVRLNQADLDGLEPGQTATVTLDAYPTREYRARLDRISPVAIASSMSDKVRGLAAIFTIDGRDEVLTPDLSAAVDVQIATWSNALTVPRDAVTWRDGKPGVQVGADWRAVSLAGFTDLDAVITDGVREGDQVARVREGRTS